MIAENFKLAREEVERARKLCRSPDISLVMDSIERAEAEEKRKARQAEGEREKQLGLKLRQEKMLSESLEVSGGLSCFYLRTQRFGKQSSKC